VTSAPTASSPIPRLSLPGLIAFGMPNVALGALAVALTVYLPRYYASHFGLPLAVVGGAFGIVRLIDMTFDPFIGVMMDRTRTRFGRYRLWLMFGAPVLMLAVYMLFIPPGGVSYAYLIGWLFLYYIGTSLIGLSHSSWASVIAHNYNERSRVFGVIQVIGVLGATAVLIIPIVMAKHDGSSGAGDVNIMGWFVFLAAPIGVALAVLRTPERIVRHAAQSIKLRDYWERVSRPDMRRIIIADFCLALGPGWMSAMYLFYFHDARGFSIGSSSLLLGLYIVAGVLGAGVLSWIATRVGKHRTLMFAAVGYSLGLIGLSQMPKNAFALVAPFMFLMGFLASSFPLLDRAMVADVGDAVRLEQGQHRVGLLFAMITSAQKIANGLSITLTLAVLGAIGYKAKEGVVNTPEAIRGLELVYLIGPVVFVMLGAACFIGYKLDRKRHAEIRAALDERDAQSTEAAVLEGLAGPGAHPTTEPG
jgi:GPH family glycoside/pentoside/hexuronide:cation symporter